MRAPVVRYWSGCAGARVQNNLRFFFHPGWRWKKILFREMFKQLLWHLFVDLKKNFLLVPKLPWTVAYVSTLQLNLKFTSMKLMVGWSRDSDLLWNIPSGLQTLSKRHWILDLILFKEHWFTWINIPSCSSLR